LVIWLMRSQRLGLVSGRCSGSWLSSRVVPEWYID
jgi:hypothetical protein